MLSGSAFQLYYYLAAFGYYWYMYQFVTGYGVVDGWLNLEFKTLQEV